MENPIKTIYQWNQKAGNLDNEYSDVLETSMSIEESLEGFELETLEGVIENNIEIYDYKGESNGDYNAARGISRFLAKVAHEGVDSTSRYRMSDVDRADKHIDNIIINIGSLFKVKAGITPQIATKMINVVMQANMKKLGMPKDEFGKVMKPEGFVGPEAELKKILDEIQ